MIGYLSKPLKELATDLRHRFKRDVFLSTRTKIIVFHVLTVLFVVIITAALLEYVERITLAAILDSLSTAVSTGETNRDMFEEMDESIGATKLLVFSILLVSSVLMGIIVSRFTLRPVREAFRMQKRFIASIAHELRTPLATLKTQNEVAALDHDHTSPIARTLKENVEEIDRITEILNNLLLFNRVDTLEDVTFEDVDLTSVIRTVVTRLDTFAEKRGVTLTYEQIDVPKVYGNATALEQAFFNVIKNGLNYTPRGGEVHITCSSVTEKEVTIKVLDTGVGMSKKDLKHVFEPFYRTSTSHDMGRGSGLGLAIVLEIIKLHRGSISVESGEGEGTHIYVTIPREAYSTATQPTASEHGVSYDFKTYQDV